jgi:hypothetical protein
MMMMMTVCPAHKKPSFIFFFQLLYSLLYISSICFFCFFFIWLRDKHYVRAHNRLWVA